jgi:hypothetical protein
MSNLRAKLFGLLTFVFLFSIPLMAAEEGAGSGVLVADTRKLHGLELWWGNIYNDGHVVFAVITVLIIPTCGVILGSLADQVMKRLGIDLKNKAAH